MRYGAHEHGWSSENTNPKKQWDCNSSRSFPIIICLLAKKKRKKMLIAMHVPGFKHKSTWKSLLARISKRKFLPTHQQFLNFMQRSWIHIHRIYQDLHLYQICPDFFTQLLGWQSSWYLVWPDKSNKDWDRDHSYNVIINKLSLLKNIKYKCRKLRGMLPTRQFSSFI